MKRDFRKVIRESIVFVSLPLIRITKHRATEAGKAKQSRNKCKGLERADFSFSREVEAGQLYF